MSRDGVREPKLRCPTLRSLALGAPFWAPSGEDVRTTLIRLDRSARRRNGEVLVATDGSFRITIGQRLPFRRGGSWRRLEAASVEIEGRVRPWGTGAVVEGRIRANAVLTLLCLLGASILGTMALIFGTLFARGTDHLGAQVVVTLPMAGWALLLTFVLARQVQQCRAAPRIITQAFATYLRQPPLPQMPTGAAAPRLEDPTAKGPYMRQP